MGNNNIETAIPNIEQWLGPTIIQQPFVNYVVNIASSSVASQSKATLLAA